MNTLKTLVLCSFLLLSFTSHSQTQQWTSLGELSGGSMDDILFYGGQMYATTDNGNLYRSEDGGANWLKTAQDFAVAHMTVMDDSIFIVGFNSYLYKGVGLSQLVKPGPMPLNPGGIVKQNNLLVTWNRDGASMQFFKSGDGGKSWTLTGRPTELSGYEKVYASGNTILVNGGGRMLRSTDQGENFTFSYGADDAHLFGGIYDCAVNSNGHVYLITETGAYRSTDQGSSWTHLGAPGPITNSASSSFDIDNNYYVFAHVDGKVYKRGTHTWSTKPLTLPNAMSVVKYHETGASFFAANIYGIFKSVDGSIWADADQGIKVDGAYKLNVGSDGTVAAIGGNVIRTNSDDAFTDRYLRGGSFLSGVTKGDTAVLVFSDSLYVTTDNFKTGKMIVQPSANWNIAITDSKLYKVTLDYNGGPMHLFTSTNLGDSWSETIFENMQNGNRTEASFIAADEANGLLYASYFTNLSGSQNDKWILYKIDLANQTRTILDSVQYANMKLAGGVLWGEDRVNGKLKFYDPAADSVTVAGTLPWDARVLATDRLIAYSFNVNGGKLNVSINKGLSWRTFDLNFISWLSAFTFDKEGHLYIVGNGEVFKSDFKVIDDDAPQIMTFSPLNGAEDVDRYITLQIDFDKAVTPAAGKHLFLYEKEKPEQLLSIPVTSGTTTNKLSYKFKVNALPFSETIEIAIEDSAFYTNTGNHFTGLLRHQWSFTTNGNVATERSAESTQVIYPNPTSGTSHWTGKDAIKHISITNVLGTKQTFTTWSGNELNFTTVPPGFYILEVTEVSENISRVRVVRE